MAKRCAWCTAHLPKRQPTHTNLCTTCYAMSADPRQHCACGARLGINERFGQCSRCYVESVRGTISKVYGEQATVKVQPMHDNSPQLLDNALALDFVDHLDNEYTNQPESIRPKGFISSAASICRHHASLAASRVRAWGSRPGTDHDLWMFVIGMSVTFVCWLLAAVAGADNAGQLGVVFGAPALLILAPKIWGALGWLGRFVWRPVRARLVDAAVLLMTYVYVGPLAKPLTQFIVGDRGRVLYAEQLWPKQKPPEPIVITHGAMLFIQLLMLISGFVLGLLW